MTVSDQREEDYSERAIYDEEPIGEMEFNQTELVQSVIKSQVYHDYWLCREKGNQYSY